MTEIAIVENANKESEYNLDKKIGIVAYSNGSSLGVSLTYLSFARRFSNNLEIIYPLKDEINKDLDLLILPGGPDVDSSRYTKTLNFYTGRPDPIREWFDVNVLPLYIENNTPIFGICRGHQTLAVHFGGKLCQHMWHETTPENERDKLVHNITYLEKNGMLATQKVNSLHHQTVHIPPKNAIISGWYSGTKLKSFEFDVNDIEAIIYRDYPIASVQWHPEEIYDDYSEDLVYHLLSGNFDANYYLK